MREETSLREVPIIRMSSTYVRTKRLKSLFVRVNPKDKRFELGFWNQKRDACLRP